ncbi:MAG: tRNA preQ1(34) S-adenosylmethionine ribosyltransferase-isomerase QueA [Candidatus Eremiobacteraeota bacterium]|nr:tRNA preQ1(34) S-adenosylmethionine ribosyltransferase-isomerase QueA [Candidatus Eremiobacteraeota bacterium]
MTAAEDCLTAAFDFELDPELVAQHPAERRDASRLMVVGPTGNEHRRFSDLAEYFAAGDVLVLNETRVIAARLRGRREPSGGAAEFLLLHPARSARYQSDALRWVALAKPARRLRAGERVVFEKAGSATVVAELSDGLREIEIASGLTFEAFLAKAGTLPLPPYIHNDSVQAQERYQTVFARVPGSVAAPTASLHFTPELLARLASRGVEIVRVALDVGLGTFRPMTAERVDEHAMHAETYVIEPPAAAALEAARAAHRRIVAAGTTVVRALEGNIRTHGRIVSGEHATDLFIRPGFDFRVVDAMITNFHLPRSSLLVLVSAFAGRRRMLDAYREAAALRYRFFSFGDAMLVLARSPQAGSP